MRKRIYLGAGNTYNIIDIGNQIILVSHCGRSVSCCSGSGRASRPGRKNLIHWAVSATTHCGTLLKDLDDALDDGVITVEQKALLRKSLQDTEKAIAAIHHILERI